MKVKFAHINQLTLQYPKFLLDELTEIAKSRRFYHIILLDIGLFIRSQFNKKLRDIINSANLVIPKGKLLLWSLKKILPANCIQLIESSENISQEQEEENLDLVDDISLNYYITQSHNNLTDYSNFLILLISHFEKQKVGFFFLGDSPENVFLATRHIKQSFPDIKILGTHPAKQLRRQPYEILEKLKKVEPHILIISDRRSTQDIWIKEHQMNLSSTICIGMTSEIQLFAGKQNKFTDYLKLFLKGGWMIPIKIPYYFILVFLYKTILKKEIQCLT